MLYMDKINCINWKIKIKEGVKNDFTLAYQNKSKNQTSSYMWRLAAQNEKALKKGKFMKTSERFLETFKTTTKTKTQPLLACKQLSLRPCKNRLQLGSRSLLSLFSFAIFPWTGNARNMISYVTNIDKTFQPLLAWRQPSLWPGKMGSR